MLVRRSATVAADHAGVQEIERARDPLSAASPLPPPAARRNVPAGGAMRLSARVVVGVAVLMSWACGGGTPEGPPTRAAAVSVSFAPDPVRAGPCPPSSCGPVTGELEVTGTLTLRETGGAAATVQSVALELRFTNATTARAQLDAAAVTQLAGSNRLAANATLAIPVGMHFTPAAGLLPGTWLIGVTLQDEGGRSLTPSIAVAVQ
jgi:hypothetical protein